MKEGMLTPCAEKLHVQLSVLTESSAPHDFRPKREGMVRNACLARVDHGTTLPKVRNPGFPLSSAEDMLERLGSIILGLVRTTEGMFRSLLHPLASCLAEYGLLVIRRPPLPVPFEFRS